MKAKIVKSTLSSFALLFFVLNAFHFWEPIWNPSASSTSTVIKSLLLVIVPYIFFNLLNWNFQAISKRGRAKLALRYLTYGFLCFIILFFIMVSADATLDDQPRFFAFLISFVLLRISMHVVGFDADRSSIILNSFRFLLMIAFYLAPSTPYLAVIHTKVILDAVVTSLLFDTWFKSLIAKPRGNTNTA